MFYATSKQISIEFTNTAAQQLALLHFTLFDNMKDDIGRYVKC